MDQSAAIQHVSLTERTVDTLTSDILSGELGREESLPAARVLSDRYGVSVLVIREALAQLQARGLLDKRQGRRTRVIMPDHTVISAVLRVSAQMQEVAVDELQECRAGLEVKAAELAALADRPDKAELLEPILQAMSAAKTRSSFNQQDLALHMAIANLSGNRPIQMVLAALGDVIREALDVTYTRVASQMGKRGIRGALEIHEEIAQAVLAGDATGAADAMTRHFQYVGGDHHGAAGRTARRASR